MAQRQRIFVSGKVIKMNLNFEEIKSITTGVAKIVDNGTSFEFHRFTEEQENFEKARVDDLYRRSLASSGIAMYFKTDSKKMSLDITALPLMNTNLGPYFSFDVFVDGVLFDSINNFDGVELEKNYFRQSFTVGNFNKTFLFKEGEKKICIYFPFTVISKLNSLELDDGASFVPDIPQKTLLCYGDSITQGCEVLHPSGKYTSILARKLNAWEFNKGLAGDICVGEFPLYRDDIKPDFITVAYGTNDWSCCPTNIFIRHTKMFYEKLTEAYPEAKIFAISPIWRANCQEISRVGAFADVEKIIKEYTSVYSNVHVIEGFYLVPHEEDNYADSGCLHPSDKGFSAYADNLYNAIKTHIN